MIKLNLSRRKFLTLAGIATSTSVLSGCDAFDFIGSDTNMVRQTLQKANSLSYVAQRSLQGPVTLAREYSQSEIRQGQKPNGAKNPATEEYLAHYKAAFANYRLRLHGLITKPISFTLDELRNMPQRSQVTRHDCVEGWSTIAKWTGVPLSYIIDQAHPASTARYIILHCFDPIETSNGPDLFYGSIDLIDARHPQTILAYALNDASLPVEYGAPLRLRVERQLGYKMSKYVKSIEFVSSFANIQGGRGGYWEDQGYDWYGGI
ncbi:molybdopterin-dependent oxidoreductase [Ochrobactrum sp. MYb379]|uniref:molybdopterin-dependent oxidoreductase n=1 Tax=Ochrobactrum sp. MYb379 TaxID=2745275 RepID=UPI0030B590C1